VGQSKFGVRFDGLLEILDGLVDPRLRSFVPIVPALQVKGVRLGTLRGLLLDDLLFLGKQVNLEGFRDLFRDVALNGKDVYEVMAYGGSGLGLVAAPHQTSRAKSPPQPSFD